MTVSRRRLLTGAIQTTAAAVTATALGGRTAFADAPPPGVHPADAPLPGAHPPVPSPFLWAEFKAAPYTHPQIPNVARSGYNGGERTFPRRPVRANVLHYGARPDGSADAAPAINRAIADVGERGGGTVLLPSGTYRIDDVIQLGYSNVTLRGEGSGTTKLFATRSLTDVIGVYGSRYGGTKSAWSWAGGLVWVCPRERYRTLTDAIKAKAWPFEGWTGNERDEWQTLATITAVAKQGDFTVTVDNASALRRGDRVLLRLADDVAHSLLDHMAGDVDGTAGYDWSDKTKVLSYVPYEWPARVTAVRGHRVTLDRPLPLDTRPGWAPKLTTLIDPVINSGVEGLTIEMVETPQSQHLLDKGYNGLALQCAWDCWADDVHVVNVDNGFLLVAAKGSTLRRTRVSGRGSHHPYCCREGSHDNLIEDFAIDQRTVIPAPAGTQLHGINVEGLSSYNVWSRGRMDMGTFDTHRGLPFANVRTEITVFNDGSHGGEASAGPLYGARFTHWNVIVTNGRAGCVKIDDIAPYSATVGISEVTPFGQIDVPDFTGPLHSRLESYGTPAVTPPNLYEAQRHICG
ncbi:glycosyl hydrolase family 28-related protein [Streptomyces sp. H10-C2]|uniref:glycosyl hydrolase family 28-related protein n=1 Tax=unclassified Streptomyces TaxID=2593676 RepID=UPI0024BA2CFC|nr:MULTISPECIES: glycosyl hydrolase family 28-related protein [unclassified Streptomyces]MDJ0346676.1 glycosyl hydrolase family 28-related protein [Streptomyces sp. PH10-H1]MDJ0373900.1 glycosyl hydrolase family 28-related protein [Streptomyces sp. H10-C2]